MKSISGLFEVLASLLPQFGVTGLAILIGFGLVICGSYKKWPWTLLATRLATLACFTAVSILVVALEQTMIPRTLPLATPHTMPAPTADSTKVPTTASSRQTNVEQGTSSAGGGSAS